MKAENLYDITSGPAPKELPELPEINGLVSWNENEKKLEGFPIPHQGDFCIDFDAISWIIYHGGTDFYHHKKNKKEA